MCFCLCCLARRLPIIINIHPARFHHTLPTPQIMETLLRVLHSNSAGVSEEAMQTVGAFTYGLGHNFMKYMPQFYPYLKMGLTNYQEWQVGEGIGYPHD